MISIKGLTAICTANKGWQVGTWLSSLFCPPPLCSDCSRIPPSSPLKAPQMDPCRSATIAPTCCLTPLATSAARRPATVAQRTSAEEQEPPPQRSPSAATASLSLETAGAAHGHRREHYVSSDSDICCRVDCWPADALELLSVGGGRAWGAHSMWLWVDNVSEWYATILCT